MTKAKPIEPGRYYRLTDAPLYLVMVPIPREAVVEEPQPVHYILELDGSGSMHWTMEKALRDLQQQTEAFNDGDYLSFGFFSSKGQVSFPIKGFEITKTSREALRRMFGELRPPFNMTNFSDILQETTILIDGLSFLRMKHVLWFLSDGMANDPSVQSEHKRTEEILREGLATRLTAMMTVSYGDYADRPFLAKMASICGGEMIQSAHLREFSQALSRFITTARVFEPRVRVPLPAGATHAFTCSVEGGGVTVYEAEEGMKMQATAKSKSEIAVEWTPPNQPVVSVAPVPGEEYVFCLTAERPAGAQEGQLQKGTGLKSSSVSFRATLAAAVFLSQSERRDEAVEVLGALGDIRLIDEMNNAFAPADVGAAEASIREAIEKPGRVYEQGYREGYVPRRDAFNVLQALEMLQHDDEAIFHPRHPAFRYKRIGRKMERAPGYPEFFPVPGASSPFGDFVWHKERLNLGLRVRIAGSVSLPQAAIIPDSDMAMVRPASLPDEFETFEWKTYNIIEDAFTHTTILPAMLSRDSFVRLQIEGLIAYNEKWAAGNVYTINLEAVPVINREMADTGRSAVDMCVAMLAATRLEARMKVYKFLREELDPRREVVQRTPWTIDEQRFLLAVGFREDGSFNPPSTAVEPTDEYEVNRFRIKIKGLSNLPPVAEVREKVTNPGPRAKGLTVSQQIVADAFAEYTGALGVKDALLPVPEGTDVAARVGQREAQMRLLWLDKQMKETKAQLGLIRGLIQRPKFVIALTKTWFVEPEMTPRNPEGNKITVDGQEFTIIVDKEKVRI